MTEHMPCLICTKAQPTIGYTCEHCRDRMATHLHDIEAETVMLSAVPSMQAAHGARGGTLASHRAPARVDVLVLTDPRTAPDEHGTLGVLATLGTWARCVREERDLSWPEQVTVVSERKTLTAHLDWLCAQPYIDDLHHELRALRQQLKRANGTQDPAPEGRCYLPAPDAGTCGGPIWLDQANGHAHCGRCRSTWDGAQLALLKWELDRARAEAERPTTPDGRHMMSAHELAQRLNTTVNNIRVRAHRRGATGHNGWYDPAAFTAITAT